MLLLIYSKWISMNCIFLFKVYINRDHLKDHLMKLIYVKNTE